jgi:hypothetical protein
VYNNLQNSPTPLSKQVQVQTLVQVQILLELVPIQAQVLEQVQIPFELVPVQALWLAQSLVFHH